MPYVGISSPNEVETWRQNAPFKDSLSEMTPQFQPPRRVVGMILRHTALRRLKLQKPTHIYGFRSPKVLVIDLQSMATAPQVPYQPKTRTR